MNNGVENNQTNITEQPVLTPVPETAPVVAQPAVAEGAPVVVASSPVEAQPVMVQPAAEPVLTPAPTVEQPVLTTPVVETAAPQEPVLVTPTDVAAATTEVPTTPVDVSNLSMKVDKDLDEQMKKNQKEFKKKEKQKQKEEASADKPKKSSLPFILFLVILGLGGYIFYSQNLYQNNLSELNYKCSPVNETKEEKALDLDSTLVQDLYSKVYTTIREDLAQPNWDDKMKIYLAYRQIPSHEMYDTNCNLFSRGKMEPYTCEVSTNFIPKGFKSDTLYLEWKKLFGEDTNMPLINIKLENSCIGGFEYIKDRDEYVQGYCKESLATSFKAKKELKEAVSSRNLIILTEEVQYIGNEKMDLPSYLKSGTYYYTFRLDTNYNYVLLAKTYNEKY